MSMMGKGVQKNMLSANRDVTGHCGEGGKGCMFARIA